MSWIVRLLLCLQFISNLVFLASCMPQEETSSISGSGGDNYDNIDKISLGKRNPSDLSYRHVVIQYELYESDDDVIDENSAETTTPSGPSTPSKIQLKASDTWENDIDHENRRITTEMQTRQLYEYYFYYSEITFEQPVRLLTVTIVYGLTQVSCEFYDDTRPIFKRVLPNALPRIPAVFGSSGERVNRIICHGGDMKMYSNL